MLVCLSCACSYNPKIIWNWNSTNNANTLSVHSFMLKVVKVRILPAFLAMAWSYYAIWISIQALYLWNPTTVEYVIIPLRRTIDLCGLGSQFCKVVYIWNSGNWCVHSTHLVEKAKRMSDVSRQVVDGYTTASVDGFIHWLVSYPDISDLICSLYLRNKQSEPTMQTNFVSVHMYWHMFVCIDI